MNSKPLISFVLFAYKQESFIREAVEGALSQTYSPLEIILSDDCSPDRTFEIMQEMVDSYSGPHKIILNRNEKNRGLGQHFNRVMDMAKGELIVMAAGDDISLPNRTEDLVNEWITFDNPSGIFSDIININVHGISQEFKHTSWFDIKKKSIERLPAKKIGCIYISDPYFSLLGGAAAWSKKCWNQFGPLMPDVVNEDNVMGFRSALSDGLIFLDKKLVKYRTHDSNISNIEGSIQFNDKELTTPDEYMQMEENIVRSAGRHYTIFKNILSDINYLDVENCKLNIKEINEVYESIKKAFILSYFKSQWWNLPMHVRLFSNRMIYDEIIISRLLRMLSIRLYSKLRCKGALFKRRIRSFKKRASGHIST